MDACLLEVVVRGTETAPAAITNIIYPRTDTAVDALSSRVRAELAGSCRCELGLDMDEFAFVVR